MVSTRKGRWAIRKSSRWRGTFFVSKNMFSKSFLFLLIPVAVIVFLKIAVAYFERSKVKSVPYQKKDSLLTEAEKQFFSVLQNIVADRYLIFSQVSILEILSPAGGLDTRTRYSAHNRIQAKHIDFLLCEKETIRPLIAIELDDSSHYTQQDRIARDNFLNEAFASAGLPLLHIKTSSHYNPDTIQADINSVLDKVENQA